MKRVNFNGTECELRFSEYSEGGNPAITLTEIETGEPFATATVNLPNELKNGEIAIKDWSENYGMLKVLVDSEIISEPLRYVWKGYVRIPICELYKY